MPPGLAWGQSVNGPLDSEHLIEEPALSNFARADASLDAQVEQFPKIETSEALTNSLPQFSMMRELLIYGNGRWR